jgi:lipid-binding SYLF domain-containing protein
MRHRSAGIPVGEFWENGNPPAGMPALPEGAIPRHHTPARLAIVQRRILGNVVLMKRIMISLLVLGLATVTFALDKTDLDGRVKKLTSLLETLQAKPDKSIPADVLRRAQGIVLLDRTKGGFIFAYEGGGGVALVRDRKSEKWSPVAFMRSDEASLGVQIGGEQSFCVILLMNTNATRLLTEANFAFGGEARGTAGKDSKGEEGSFSAPEPSMRVYGDRHGLYGGAAVKGGAVSPDDEANRVYYGQPVSMQDILFDKKVKPTDLATALAGKLKEYSKAKQ